MAEHTPTPWEYRPHYHDDWGWIRGPKPDGATVGPLVAMTRSGLYETQEQLGEHRGNKTDPYGANAVFIVKAVNNHESMLQALERIANAIEIDAADMDVVLEAIAKATAGALQPLTTG